MIKSDILSMRASVHGMRAQCPRRWGILAATLQVENGWHVFQARYAVLSFRRRRALMAILLLCAAPLAHADCFEEAAGYQHVNPWVLRAIAWQESRGRAEAIHVNKNGTIDYGKMQINSIHLRRLSSYGISRDELMQPCVSVYVAAWRLREMVNKYGNTWAAVGAYHSETPAERNKYAQAIHGILLRRGVISE
ncbi:MULTISPECIES: lytic transglycosylase domain-containing protein [Xanthomonas]|nr:lytic transglycosylase domain-containing protein [Xanthomonas cucurbitae]